ncbi:MAG: CBS domain-containing protein [Haloechinothrix sp.]
MRIADVLRSKGTEVATVEPSATVSELLAALAEHNIGAMVVLDKDGVVGIVSERDVVRRLNERGAALLDTPVAEIMTTDVATCTPDETVDHLTVLMTERRIRHVPVLVGTRLAGIVSIGDVVKSRMNELEHTQEQLQNYIVQG